MAFNIVTLVAASATTPTSKVIHLDNAGGDESVVIQAVLSSTGTVVVEGSLDGTNWAQLGSNITTSSIVAVTRTPYLRVRVTANAGTISVLVAD